MNEDDMTLDQIIAFHTLMCEAQKIIDSWDAEDDDFEKYNRQTPSYNDDER